MHVLVSGATGFVGTRVCELLRESGHVISALTRSPERARVEGAVRLHRWEPTTGPPPLAALESAEAVVHLAGESVAGRWTQRRRRAIRDSRVMGTHHLVAAIRAAERPPRVLVSASAIGYYGDRGDERLPERSAPGEGFLAEVSHEWEAEAEAAEELGVRVVRLRLAVVLGSGGGALERMLPPARLGISGPLGSGRQWWSWVHREDVARLALFALEHEISGAFNAAAPEPVRQADFARALGRAVGRPAVVPTPGFALRIVLGGFAASLLASSRVVPERTQAAGFAYRFPELSAALTASL